MSAKTGRQAKLYYKTPHIDSPGSWNEIENVMGDLMLSDEKGEAEVTTRGSGGYRQFLTTLIAAGVEFKMVWDPDDADFEALHDAYHNDSLIGIAVMDGAIDSGTGLIADMKVFKFSRGEPMEDVMTAEVTLKPTYSTRRPRWIEDGSSPTGTETY